MRNFDNRKNTIVLPEDRRKKNNEYIKKNGIVCFENLPILEASNFVKLKDIDSICKRAIACLLSIQLACDIVQHNDFEKAKELIWKLLKKYNVENDLLPNEKSLFDQTYSEQDVIDVTWSYESYWSLIWALGLIDDIKNANDICDCNKAIQIVSKCDSYENFKDMCKMRDIEEILDMLDLYFRYHWACVEKSIRPDTNIQDLNCGVVMERRKGLEWLIAEEFDWNDIALNT